MKKNRCIVKSIAALLVLMLAVNAAVLHFCFDIRISDLAGFIAGNNGDSSAENGDRDGSSNRGIAEWDGPAGSDRDSTSAGESDYGSSRSDGTNDTEDPGDSSTMPADVMEAMKKLSFSDKLFLLGIFARIGKSEMKEILSIVQDGVAAGEMEKLKAYADDYLEPSDIARLEDMLARYGHIYVETGK